MGTEEVGGQPSSAQMTDNREYITWAAAAAAAMQGWYNPRRGLWTRVPGGTGWWNAANNLTALIGYMQATGSREYMDVIATTYERNLRSRFITKFYDDTMWWGLAWIAAFDLTAESRYLAAARTAFDYVTGTWTESCGGGIPWSKYSSYKNAITNELFLLLALRMYQRMQRSADLDWALREWAWFRASGMINPANLVNDGLTPDCQNIGEPTWTYNQGVILAALADLSAVTANAELLAQAQTTADAAITQLVDADGVLREPGEPQYGNDAPQFKGIFMRHLAYLYRAAREDRYRHFIMHNAVTLWCRARNTRNQIGLYWAGPADHFGAAQQGSALDALTAAVPFGQLSIVGNREATL